MQDPVPHGLCTSVNPRFKHEAGKLMLEEWLLRLKAVKIKKRMFGVLATTLGWRFQCRELPVHVVQQQLSSCSLSFFWPCSYGVATESDDRKGAKRLDLMSLRTESARATITGMTGMTGADLSCRHLQVGDM